LGWSWASLTGLPAALCAAILAADTAIIGRQPDRAGQAEMSRATGSIRMGRPFDQLDSR
jgi:hypothetical protein